MDIVAYLRLIRRHWKIIVAATVIGILLGVASTVVTRSTGAASTSTYYKATHTLFLDTSAISDQVQPIYTNLDQIAVLVTTGDVPRRVAAKIGGEGGDLATHIFTVTNGTTNTLDIVCAEKSADDAVLCADTFAEELVTSLQEREQDRFNRARDDTIQRIDSIQNQINALDEAIAAKPANLDLLQAQRNSLINQYRLSYEKFEALANQGGPVSVVSTLENAEAQRISQAEYDERIARGRSGQNRIRGDIIDDSQTLQSDAGTTSNRFSSPISRGFLGGLLGLMIGIGLAVVADRVDRRLRSREEVEAAFGMPVLAEIPNLTATQRHQHLILSASAPLSRTAEAYRAVRSSLMFQRATDARPSAPGEALVVLVGSAGPREGKTTTSANLAAMFAETGLRVLVVNCDFRRPSLHHFFDLPNEPRRVFETQIANLWVVTDVIDGPSSANPAFVVEEQRRLVASAKKRFDVVVLDTAPMLTTNDATDIMTSADLAVIVCRSGVTTADAAERVRELLSRIDAPVSGVALLGSEASPNDYYYYYSRSRAQQIARGVPPEAAAGEGESDPTDDEPPAAADDEPTNGNGAEHPVGSTPESPAGA